MKITSISNKSSFSERNVAKDLNCEKSSSKTKFAINHYFINLAALLGVLASIYCMFYVQFRFDNLETKVSLADKNIYLLEDEIRTVEVEWTYLTRPERLRVLSKKYLTANDHASPYRIKTKDAMNQFFAFNHKEQQSSQLAMK